jgi:nicotinamidase-related amidase
MNQIVGTAVLLIIDMQHDFLDADAPVLCADGWQIVPGIQQLATAARQAGVPIIYTQEVHRATRIDFGRELDGAEGLHCVDGSRGVRIVDELAPQAGDSLVRKPRYSAFIGTDLPYVLNGVGVRPGDTLIITGVATDVCVHYTAADAHQHDYRVRVVADCVAGTSPEAHAAALQAIEYLQADSLTDRERMLAALATYDVPQLAARAAGES